MSDSESICLSELDWHEIRAEAQREGVSASEFVRKAALREVSYRRGLRGEPRHAAAVLDVIRKAVASDRTGALDRSTVGRVIRDVIVTYDEGASSGP